MPYFLKQKPDGIIQKAILVALLGIFLTSCGAVKFGGGGGDSAKKQDETIDPPKRPDEPIPPNPPNPPIPTPPVVDVQDLSEQITVAATNNKVDILLVIDDSNSMLDDNKKLAQNLSGFVQSLQSSSIDWQMCTTVTRQLSVNDKLAWGASIEWSNYTPASGVSSWVLKPTANAETVFNETIKTIGAGWANTDDERGIKAAWWHIYNGDPAASGNSGCYRKDAGLAVILISDEDVRSVGGNPKLEFYSGEYKSLENDDLPDTLIKQVKDVFGDTKRFTVNSIIVKPEDQSCLKSQDDGGSKSHYGVLYKELSEKTGGAVTSICETDFSKNLNLFKDAIIDSLASTPLKCPPVSGVTVTVTPSFEFKHTILGNSIVFEPKLPAGRTLSLKYQCKK